MHLYVHELNITYASTLGIGSGRYLAYQFPGTGGQGMGAEGGEFAVYKHLHQNFLLHKFYARKGIGGCLSPGSREGESSVDWGGRGHWGDFVRYKRAPSTPRSTSHSANIFTHA